MKKYEEHELRVMEEKKELDCKIVSLKMFFSSDLFLNLQNKDRHLLEDQYKAMLEYSMILYRRICRFNGGE